MASRLKRIIGSLVDNPVKSLVLCLLVLGGLTAGLAVKGLSMEVRDDIWFLEDDPTMIAYQRLPKLFGEDKFTVVAVSVPDDRRDVFNEDTLAVVDEVEAFLKEQDLVVRVRSLASYQHIQTADDTVYLHKVWPLKAPYDSFDKLRDLIMNDDLTVGSVVSADGRHALIVARVDRVTDDVKPHNQFTADLEAFVESKLDRRGHEITLAGEPIMFSWIMKTSERDQQVMLPIVLLFMLVPLVVIFRRRPGITGPGIVVTAATVATMGFVALVGNKLNLVSFALPVILLPIGLADAIHMVTEFFRRYRTADGGNAKEAAKAAACHVFLPCLLTTVTTVAGFLALVPSSLRPVRELGYEAAFGVALVLFVTIVALPIFLSRYKGKEWRPHAHAQGVMQKFSVWAARFCEKYCWILAAGSVALVVAASTQLGGIRAESDNKSLLKESSSYHQQMVRIDEIRGGSVPLEFIFDSGKTEGIKDPKFLKQVEAFTAWLNEQHLGARTRTVVDYLKGVNESMELLATPDAASTSVDYRSLPPEQPKIAQSLFVYESMTPGDALENMIDSSQRYLRLTLPMPLVPRTEYERRMDIIKAHLAEHHPDLEVTLTGTVVLTQEIDAYLIDTARSSFGFAFLVVIIFLGFAVRSFRLWLLAIIPNAFPIVVIGGAMAVTDTPLDFATTMIAAITFGLVVDDTIHFMTRIRENLKLFPLRHALEQSYREVGTAILTTSIVLILGFSVYLFGSFVPNIRFGAIASAVILLALIADLFLVPAFLFLIWPQSEQSVGGLPATLKNEEPEVTHE